MVPDTGYPGRARSYAPDMFLSALTLVAVTGALPAPSHSAQDLRARIQEHYRTDLRELFEHFHANPELSFLEFETAKRLAAELRAVGVEVTERVGGTGIVGMLENGEVDERRGIVRGRACH